MSFWRFGGRHASALQRARGLHLTSLRVAVLVVVLGAAAHAEPLNLPPAFTARYSGAMGLVDSRMSLKRMGRFLLYEIRTELAGFRFYECSVVEAGETEFWPREYIHRRVGGSEERDIEARFEREQHRILLTRGGKTEVLSDVDFPVWDALSVQLRMSADLSAGSLADSYKMVDKGGVQERRFALGARQRVTVGGSEYDAVRIDRTDREERSYVTVAPKLHHLPVELGYNARWIGWVRAQLIEFTPTSGETKAEAPPRCQRR